MEFHIQNPYFSLHLIFLGLFYVFSLNYMLNTLTVPENGSKTHKSLSGQDSSQNWGSLPWPCVYISCSYLQGRKSSFQDWCSHGTADEFSKKGLLVPWQALGLSPHIALWVLAYVSATDRSSGPQSSVTEAEQPRGSNRLSSLQPHRRTKHLLCSAPDLRPNPEGGPACALGDKTADPFSWAALHHTSQRSGQGRGPLCPEKLAQPG